MLQASLSLDHSDSGKEVDNLFVDMNMEKFQEEDLLYAEYYDIPTALDD